MKLEPGQSFGAYRILSLLGTGGMGAVYRAHDTKLKRDVAIKILPGLFARDEERMKRFEREAHVLASLNHPNIEAIYGLEEADAERGLVLELVEGPTLAERIAEGPIPVEEALAISRQMAEALDVAHEKGIVHRDLKPANVKLTQEGQVKILDFGLAKPLLETTSGGDASSLSRSPTMMKGTEAGIILGTAGYMAPEQARGKNVDKRADIWAFGVILYEMLSGARLFEGETVSDTLAAVLTRDPDFRRLPLETPGSTRRLLARLLERDPRKRLRDIADACSDLEPGAPPDGVEEAAPKRNRLRSVAVALVSLLLASALAYEIGRRTADETSLPSFRQLTLRRGTVAAARFAPERGTVLYSAAWDGHPNEMFSARLDAPESSLLDLPSGTLVGVTRGEVALLLSNGTLARAPMGLGAPREVLAEVEWADWAADGSSFAVVRRVKGSERLEFPIGNSLYETVGALRFLRISPSAEWVAFVEQPLSGYTNGWVRIVNLEGDLATSSDRYGNFSGVAWRDDGEVWYSAQEPGRKHAVYALPVSGGSREILRSPGSLSLHDISRDGRLLVSQDTARFETIGLAPGESRERDLTWLDRTYVEDITPDGRTIVFHESGIGGEMIAGGSQGAAFLRGTDGSPAVRLGVGQPLALSPDGKWVTLVTDEAKARMALYPTGAGDSRELPAGTVRQYYDAWWFPDGRRLLISGNEENRPRRLFIQDISGGDPKPFTPEGVWTLENAISPDGKWVAAGARDEGAPMSLYPVEGGEVRAIPGLSPRDYVLRFGPDARHLFVTEGERSVALSIFRLDLETGVREPWNDLTPADPAGIPGIAWVCLTPDGRSYAYTYARVLSDLYLVEE